MALPPFVKIFVRDVFRIALVTFVVYFFADLLKPGLVTNYINLNALLLFVIGSGIATILLTPLEVASPKGPSGAQARAKTSNGVDGG